MLGEVYEKSGADWHHRFFPQEKSVLDYANRLVGYFERIAACWWNTSVFKSIKNLLLGILYKDNLVGKISHRAFSLSKFILVIQISFHDSLHSSDRWSVRAWRKEMSEPHWQITSDSRTSPRLLSSKIPWVHCCRSDYSSNEAEPVF